MEQGAHKRSCNRKLHALGADYTCNFLDWKGVNGVTGE